MLTISRGGEVNIGTDGSIATLDGLAVTDNGVITVSSGSSEEFFIADVSSPSEQFLRWATALQFSATAMLAR